MIKNNSNCNSRFQIKIIQRKFISDSFENISIQTIFLLIIIFHTFS